MKTCIIYPILLFFILSGINNLSAQININDKRKPITPKVVTEKNVLPSEIMEGVEAYREFSSNPQLRNKSAVQVGSEIDFDFGFGDEFKGTVIAVTEYIEGITAVTTKLQGYDFAYGYMAI